MTTKSIYKLMKMKIVQMSPNLRQNIRKQLNNRITQTSNANSSIVIYKPNKRKMKT